MICIVSSHPTGLVFVLLWASRRWAELACYSRGPRLEVNVYCWSRSGRQRMRWLDDNELCQLLFVRLGSLVSMILPSSKGDNLATKFVLVGSKKKSHGNAKEGSQVSWK